MQNESSKRIAELESQNRALREALGMAINTVECASIDLKEGPTKGEELPWYKLARKALDGAK